MSRMEGVIWRELLMSEGWMKYTLVPGSLLFGGCLLVYAGYYMGTRKAKIGSGVKEEKAEEKRVIEISCSSSIGRDLHRANSERSLASTDDSERGSPVGDSYRCALIVRKDCGLARGKIIIHSCRAFLAEFKKMYKQKDPDLKEWERDGMTVVVLRADSENELLSIKAKAADIGVSSHTFCSKESDGTSLKSVMALGPSKTTLVRELTQHLLRL